MGKISLVSAKYIIHASIEIKGAVDKPDVIGAIFGQTEGLLGSDLELRELQRSGRIGRIEVKVETQGGNTKGSIIIPSSLDKTETSIVGAALEIIQRIGPCDSKIRVEKIEDVRISKREFVLGRAKELLKHLQEDILPDSFELAEEVSHSVRVMEITEYGADRLPAGPEVADSEEILIVEGRADVLNLLKHGIKNAIAMNGTSCPQTIKDLTQKKVATAFVDGDRGGDLIIRELNSVANLDFFTKAPDGKEVEELTKKELFNALRHKKPTSDKPEKSGDSRPVKRQTKRPTRQTSRSSAVTDDEKAAYKALLEDLIGTKAAIILDKNQEMLGRVPLAELASTIKNVDGVHAVVLDSDVTQDIVEPRQMQKIYTALLEWARKEGISGKVKVLSVDEL